MQTYILFTKLSPEATQQMKGRAKQGRAWLKQVHEKCPDVRFLTHFDFLDIYEAPDDEVAAKVSMISLQNGAFHAESHPAIPYKKFLELAEEI